MHVEIPQDVTAGCILCLFYDLNCKMRGYCHCITWTGSGKMSIVLQCILIFLLSPHRPFCSLSLSLFPNILLNLVTRLVELYQLVFLILSSHPNSYPCLLMLMEIHQHACSRMAVRADCVLELIDYLNPMPKIWWLLS